MAIPFEQDPAFIRAIVKIYTVTTEARDRLRTRWRHVLANQVVDLPFACRAIAQGYRSNDIKLSVKGKLRHCRVVRHEDNGQVAFIQMDLQPGFDIYQFLNGQIPRAQQLDHHCFEVDGRNVWVFDPKEQFLGGARETD